MLERAGIERADLVVAVTGDDEDNIIVCQVARDGYGVTFTVTTPCRSHFPGGRVVLNWTEELKARVPAK